MGDERSVLRRYRRQALEAGRLVGGFLVLTGIAFLAVDGVRFAVSLLGGAT